MTEENPIERYRRMHKEMLEHYGKLSKNELLKILIKLHFEKDELHNMYLAKHASYVETCELFNSIIVGQFNFRNSGSYQQIQFALNAPSYFLVKIQSVISSDYNDLDIGEMYFSVVGDYKRLGIKGDAPFSLSSLQEYFNDNEISEVLSGKDYKNWFDENHVTLSYNKNEKLIKYDMKKFLLYILEL